MMPLKIIQLPEPRLKGPLSLEETLAKRQSMQGFTAQALSYTQISQLVWAALGVREKQEDFPMAPSMGATNPMELHVSTQDGVFAYNPREHNLMQTSRRDVRIRLAAAAFKQAAVAEAACNIIVTGAVKKVAPKNRNKARRLMLLQAGHIAQNIQLQAVSLELGCVPVGEFNMKDVNKACGLPAGVEPLYIICVGNPIERPIEKGGEEEEARGTERRKPKRAVLIIASKNFRDEEFFETKFVLGDAGVETVTASTKKGAIKGMLGGIADATILVNDIVVDGYDAIIFIGGSGAVEYFNNGVALDIAREAADKGKILAAICIAPSVLANAGVLNGVRVTGFPSEQARLQRAGAIYTGAPVERDGLLITGRGPESARLFGGAVADAILSR
jgi:protease I